MIRHFLFLILLLTSHLASSQVEFFGFDNVAEYNSWTYQTNMTPPSWDYDNPSQRIHYTVNTSSLAFQTSEQFLSRTLINPVGFQFIASFKLNRQMSGTNSYFPIMFTPSILTGSNLHPWRINPPTGSTLGAQQNVGLLGVIITHNKIGIIHRTDGLTNGAVANLTGYTLPINQDVWVRLERICATTVKLEVYSDAAMTNLLAGQTFTVSNAGSSLEALYIANCNGNGTTTVVDDMLDDYKIETVASSTPTFSVIGPYCSGTNIPALPTTSLNGIPGTWSPAINNTATTTYTFTPNDITCFNQTSMNIVITSSSGVPTFNAVSNICSGETITPLPTTSQNGITGSWSPVLNNLTTTTYTFSPAPGQCATSVTATIIVDPATTPIFNAVNPVCFGESISPLPTSSLNGIAGNWSPTLNNLATTSYTFTPTAGQCVMTTSMTIVVTPETIPNFNSVPGICAADNLSPLPQTSLNNITGSWSPAANNMATTTYTFSPDLGQCASSATTTIVVDPITTPTFNAINPVCFGESMSALPNNSLNGIAGNWAPALNNLATTTYTFVPTAGQCALNTSMTIVVTPETIPTFNNVPDICTGDNLSPLPQTALNNITGSWSPVVNNMATTTYTFSPDLGQCASSITTTITVDPTTTPNFNNVLGICAGDNLSPLPLTSLNNIAGSWSPALNNMTTTAYTFSPDPGQCAANASLSITVSPGIVIPTFDHCSGTVLANLNLTSIEGVTGSWANNSSGNPNNFTFTPDPGQCASTVDITFMNPPATSFTAVNVCEGNVTNFINNTTVSSGIITSTTWNFDDGSSSTDSNPSHLYTDNGQYNVLLVSEGENQCIDSMNMLVEVFPNPVAQFGFNTPCEGQTIDFIDLSTIVNASTNSISSWDWSFGVSSPQSNLQNPSILTLSEAAVTTNLTVTSNNGCENTISNVVQVNPLPEVSFISSAIEGCASLCVVFENTSSIAEGNIVDISWDFGEGRTSTEVKPEICFNNTDSLSVMQTISLTTTSDQGCIANHNAVDYLTLYGTVSADFNMTLSNGISVFENLSINANSSDWIFDDYGFSSDYSPSFIFPDSEQTNYETCLLATSIEGCVDSICKDISVEEELGYYIPNAFTPNGDGVNDFFTPILYAISSNQFEFLIFDRWGALVFETNSTTNAIWDGTYKGEVVPQDVYVWRIKGESKFDRTKFFEASGHVTIIR